MARELTRTQKGSSEQASAVTPVATEESGGVLGYAFAGIGPVPVGPNEIGITPVGSGPGTAEETHVAGAPREGTRGGN